MTKDGFLDLLPEIRRVAKDLGYAIGLHGTLTRDFDLIAVPWIEEAVHPDELALAIRKVTGCVRWRVYRDQGTPKPHGRMVYCFDWDKANHECSDYIDLSVMPRLGTDTTGGYIAVNTKAIRLGFYKHYKGGIYELVGISTHSETLESMAVYIRQDQEHSMWVRPLDMFTSDVLLDGVWVPRFERIDGLRQSFK